MMVLFMHIDCVRGHSNAETQALDIELYERAWRWQTTC